MARSSDRLGSRRSLPGRRERVFAALPRAAVLASLLLCVPALGAAPPPPADEGQASPPSEPAAAPGAAAATPSLGRVFAPGVRALGRDIHTYHYVQRSRVGLPQKGFVRPDHAMVEPYLRHKIGRFWDEEFYEPSPGNPVSALYVATDPVASRVFGGQGASWVLFEVVLGRGFRYLDLRTERGERRATDLLPEPLQERLAEAGCPVRYGVDLFLDRGPRPCRSIAEGVLVELDVDGVLFDFRAAPLEGCGDGRAQGGFVLLRLEALDLGRVGLYVHEGSDGGASPRRRRIQGLFARARAAGSRHELLWPELGAGEPAEEPSAAWVREHLFGCGEHPEDRYVRATADPVARWRRRESALLEAEAAAGAVAHASYQVATGLAAAGKAAEARVAYERALEHDPDLVQALHDLAWLLIESGDEGAVGRAVELAERLVQVTHYRQRRSTVGWNWPKAIKGRASLTVAAAYAAAGRWKEAREYAYQHYETTAKQHRDSGTPLTAARAARAARCRERYARRQPCEASQVRRWSGGGVLPRRGASGATGPSPAP